MTHQKSYDGQAYNRIYQRLCREQNVPPRGLTGCKENKLRQSMLPRIHFQTMRLLDRGVRD